MAQKVEDVGEPAAKESKAERRAPPAPAPATAAATDPKPLSPLDSLSARDEPIPHVPAPAAAGPWRSYKEILAALAQRVLDAQRPMRILQSLRWEADVEEQFFRGRARELPRVTYASDLGFDPDAKIRELDGILADAEQKLGEGDRLGDILRA